MDAIINFFKSLIPENFDIPSYLYTAGILCGGFLVIGILGRLIFGKDSVLVRSVSGAIGILLIYAVSVLLHSYGVSMKLLMSELPLITITDGNLLLFPFLDSDYIAISGALLSMIVLAFLVNLVNSWFPEGKKLFSWFLFRIVSVLLAMVLHTIVSALLGAFLPAGLQTWAPVILVALLILMLLLGALKYVVGAILGTVNPVIGLLYTFFFSTLLGKQLSRAVLTTSIISGLILALNYVGITTIRIGTAALGLYLPLILVLLALWYLIGKVFSKK